MAARRIPSLVRPITRVSIKGFKSARKRIDVDIRPLTILAGENSAGKSTAMQPLLLMKQTLEAVHEPGVLELNGPCVRFNDAKQLLWRGRNEQAKTWFVELARDAEVFSVEYAAEGTGGFTAVKTTRKSRDGADLVLQPKMSKQELDDAWQTLAPQGLQAPQGYVIEPKVAEGRTCLRIEAVLRTSDGQEVSRFRDVGPQIVPVGTIEAIIHLPGLRGHPEREYPVTRSSGRYPGPFPPYAASTLLDWREKNDDRVEAVGGDLHKLGLTWKVIPKRLHATHVELKVGRLPAAQHGGASDLVNIADVGFGTSQVLPIVVALRAATFGQLVHIEQPELHLHPNAQVAMADLLMDAAKRGVVVVVETHSSLILKRVQTAVADPDHAFGPNDLALHWFTRTRDGATDVQRADVQMDGTYGDWPVDFADVEMRVEQDFISAAFARASGTP